MTDNWIDLPMPVAGAFDALTWAKRHCSSYITNSAVLKDGLYHYRFYFAQERDQVAFALRWLRQ